MIDMKKKVTIIQQDIDNVKIKLENSKKNLDKITLADEKNIKEKKLAARSDTLFALGLNDLTKSQLGVNSYPVNFLNVPRNRGLMSRSSPPINFLNVPRNHGLICLRLIHPLSYINISYCYLFTKFC